MGDEKEYILELLDIEKSFGGVNALKKAKIQLKYNEIHSLVGENGAGKSTLIKVMSGAHQADAGKILLDGAEISISNPRAAIDRGIAVIYQEYMLAPSVSVAENIFIDDLSGGRRGGIINWKEMNQRASELLDSIGFGWLNPKTIVGSLTVAEQQVVEICKALSRKVRIMIMDEPTSVLTFSETEKLFEILEKLKREGVSVIYVSHRLEEIIQISDHVTIMKDGNYIETVEANGLTQDHLMQKMIGRELTQMFPKRNTSIGEVVLEAKNIKMGKKVQDVSFNLRKGEVVGFAGLVGAGRTETMRAVFGADRMDSGEVIFFGEKLRFNSPLEAVKHGLGLLPENRKTEGVILDQPIRNNSTLTNMKLVKNRFGMLSLKKEASIVKDILKKINTKYSSIEDPASSLSGGNQQKVSLAKWLAANVKIIIFDEPTRGVDVGAKVEIFENINQMVEEGVSVIMISSEMNEIIGMCDRAYVMRQGKITGELSKEELTESNLIKLQMEA